MKRYGLQNVQFHFVPFIGGITTGKGVYPSHKAEAFGALAGPVFGIIPVPILVAISHLLSSPFWAAMAIPLAVLSIFNLFPALPLDGGRVVEKIAAAGGRRTRVVLLIVFLGSGWLAASLLDFTFLVFLSTFGWMFLRERPASLAKSRKMTWKEAASVFSLHLVTFLVACGALGLTLTVEGVRETLEQYW